MKALLMNVKMSKKLLLSPVCVMMFLVVFGLASYAGLSSQQRVIHSMYNESFSGYRMSAEVLTIWRTPMRACIRSSAGQAQSTPHKRSRMQASS